MGNINFNIISGTPPFEAELVGSSEPIQTFNDIGQYSFTNVSNGVYTLKITDANGCLFEKDVTVNPNITTTTTTQILGSSIVIGHAQDPLLIFNPEATNKNGDFTGYPDSDVVTLYLWFKTFNGEPLSSSEVLNYKINVTGGTGDSQFEFKSLSDQVHSEVQEDTIGPSDSIFGTITLKTGFIETYFEYIYYRGGTDKRYQIDLQSSLKKIYPNLKTKTEVGTDYGISTINNEQIILDY